MKIPQMPDGLLNQVSKEQMEAIWLKTLRNLFDGGISTSLVDAKKIAELGVKLGVCKDPLFYKIEELISSQKIDSVYVKKFIANRPLSPWALAPGSLEFLDELINEPKNILEFGSGLSTEFLSRKLSSISTLSSHQKTIISFEQDENLTIEANKNLSLLGLEKYAKVLYAPLVEINLEGLFFSIYDIRKHCEILKNFKADVVVVDGPSGGGYNRWGSILIASSFVNENAVWMLDDAVRDDELKVAEECEKHGLKVQAIQFKGKGICKGIFGSPVISFEKLFEIIGSPTVSPKNISPNIYSWDDVKSLQNIKLYAGDIPEREEYKGLIGLSITKNDHMHILHDITRKLPLDDNSIESFQAEDVFEHIQFETLPQVINEIYRVLKPGGLFRLSIPDYGNDLLRSRTIKNENGDFIFDPGGGGTRENPGHIWFPTKEKVSRLLEHTNFADKGEINFLHYYKPDGTYNLSEIDYSKGFVIRTPDNDSRVQNPRRPMSLVVDLIKAVPVINAQTTAIKPVNEPLISFVMIVLNGLPFIEYALKAIYKFAHQIIIVEGAVENCLFAANLYGSSTDGTVEFIKNFPDAKNKIIFIQGIYSEKIEMQNEALNFVTGNYVWLVDSDEVYKEKDLTEIVKLMKNDPSITQINFIPDNFWKGFDYIFVSSFFFEFDGHYRRVFKFERGARFTNHRPPTLLLPSLNKTTEEIKLIDGAQTRKMGIYPYHYSYVFDFQVQQKIELYNRYGWGEGWGIDMKEWFTSGYLKWTPENKEFIEKQYPPWTGDNNSRTEKFCGVHPAVIQNYIRGFHKIVGKDVEVDELANRVIGSRSNQQNVLDIWRFIELDSALQKRVSVIANNITSGKFFWNVHVAISYTANKLKPKSYLEVGVRTGGSLVQALSCSTIEQAALVDLWSGSYAELPNSIDYTKNQLKIFLQRTDNPAKLNYIQGNSHTVLKELIIRGAKFDLINVDGDHEEKGAWEDLVDVEKLLNEKGAIIFDDIIHPAHKYLINLIPRFLGEYPEYEAIINNSQDNGVVILLKNISKKDFLSGINKLKIAGEISFGKDLTKVGNGSNFADAIQKVFNENEPKKIIETGTYLGTGTTSIIAEALKSRDIKESKFYSIEINPENYLKAKFNLAESGLLQFVNLLNGVSVPRSILPTKDEITKSTITSVEYEDIFVDHNENERTQLYFQETNFPDVSEDLLGKALAEFDFKPDFILLDSAGYMGFIEFQYMLSKLEGNCIIALDDIYHIKHHKSFRFMQSDPRFEIIISSKEKFGFCVAKFNYNPDAVKSDLISLDEKEITNCLLCGSHKSGIVHPPDIVRCEECGFVYLKERPTQKWMENYYKDVYAVNEPAAAVTVSVPEDVNLLDCKKEYIAAQRKDLFEEAVSFLGYDIKSKTLVDIGCGWGALLYNARKSGMSVIGFEFTNHNVRFAREQLMLDVRQQQFTDTDLQPNSVDIVTMSHVLEHVPDPFLLLKKINYVLKPGGIFYCVVPNFYSLCSAFLGEKWDWLDRNWHYSQFTPDSISKLFTNVGLQIEKITTTSGDFGTVTPLKILSTKYPGKSNEALSNLLTQINEQKYGEEIRIIGKKPEETEKQKTADKNILWIRTDAIGDNILASSMLKPLKEFFSNYKITVVCQNLVRSLYETSPYVENIISFDKRNLFLDIEYKYDIISKMRGIRAEFIFNSVFSRDLLADYLTINSGAKNKIAHDGDLSNILSAEKEENDKRYSGLIKKNPSSFSELDRHQDFLNGIGAGSHKLAASISLAVEDLKYAEDIFTGHNLIDEKTVALFAGAQHEVRVYNYYGKAINDYCTKNGFSVILLGSTKDRQINQTNAKDLTVKVVDLTGTTSIRQSAAIIKKCAAAIGAETGLAHIACAVETPNLILLGGGHFGRFMPYSKLTSVVAIPLECFGCNWQCKYGTTTCIKDVDYKIISAAFNNMMEEKHYKTTVYLQPDFKYSFLSGLPKIAEIKNLLNDECEVKFLEINSTSDSQNFIDTINPFMKENVSKTLYELFELFIRNGTDTTEYSKFEKQLLLSKNEVKELLNSVSNRLKNYAFELYLMGLLLEAEENYEACFEQYVSSLRLEKNFRVLYKLAVIAEIISIVPYPFYLYQELLTSGIETPVVLKKTKYWTELLSIKNVNKLTNMVGELPVPVEPLIKLKTAQSKPLISFVLPSKKRSDGLSSFLSSLKYACFGLNYEVLLYLPDDSDEKYNKIIEEHRIKKIFFDKNILGNKNSFSWTKLMNHGFRHSDGQWIMYASDDIVLHPFAVNIALQKKGDKSIGGISFMHRNTVQDYDGFFKEYGFEIYGKRPFINFGLIRKEAFVKVKGFDESIIFYAGDTDFCWRIVESGYKIVPSFHSLVEHINIEDAIKTFNSGKIYRMDTYCFLKKWKSYISRLEDRTLVKERFILPDIKNVKKYIFETAIKNNVPIKAILAVDKEYEQFIKTNFTIEEKTIKVSAIVSTYNSESFIKGCLDDLIEQSLYKSNELEIVVIDSGSEENEGAIIKEYQKKYSNIIYEHTDKETIYAAWNRGIKLARGKYITNANTDDRHAGNALEKLAEVLDGNESIGVTYSDMYKTIVQNDFFTSNSKKAAVKWMDFDADLLLFGCFVGPQPMWRKSLHEKFGMFIEELEVVGDYEFWLRLSRDVKFHHLKEVLGLYYYSEKSAEHRNENITKNEDDNIHEYYLIKNISTNEDASRVLSKLELIGTVKELKDYYEKAKGLVMLRQNGLQIEDQLKSVIEDSNSYNTEDLISTLEQLITVLKTSEVLIDKRKYLTILYNLCGMFYLKENMVNKAKSSFENALSLNPESSESCAGLGEIFIHDEDFDAAKTMFEWAIKYEPENKQALNRLSELNNLETQTVGLAKASEANDALTNKLHDFLFAVDSLIESNEYEKSFNLLIQAQQHFSELELNESTELLQSAFAVLYGFVQLGLNNVAAAKNSFEEALQLNPNSSEACRGLGECFLTNELFDEAKTMLEWAVKNDPSNQKAVSRINKLNEQPDNSAGIVSLVIEKEEVLQESYNLFSAKKYSDAIALLIHTEKSFNGELKAEENNAFASALYNLKGFNYLALNLLEEAQQSFHKALQHNPESTKACYGLGEVFFENKDDKAAKTMFEWAVKNDPSDKLALEGLKKTNRILSLNELHNSLLE